MERARMLVAVSIVALMGACGDSTESSDETGTGTKLELVKTETETEQAEEDATTDGEGEALAGPVPLQWAMVNAGAVTDAGPAGTYYIARGGNIKEFIVIKGTDGRVWWWNNGQGFTKIGNERTKTSPAVID
ncbi:hypothetical protein LZC95_48555 [Pendulispora brunnea]|uniref:Lipoprotein n=1 Tax=Pendulispora brunnea TaxID=2905690 RepID=A0ABZ2K9P1_9BACT